MAQTGNFSPTTKGINTKEEADAYAAKLADHEEMLAAMTKSERYLYLEMLANTPPEDLE